MNVFRGNSLRTSALFAAMLLHVVFCETALPCQTTLHGPFSRFLRDEVAGRPDEGVVRATLDSLVNPGVTFAQAQTET